MPYEKNAIQIQYEGPERVPMPAPTPLKRALRLVLQTRGGSSYVADLCIEEFEDGRWTPVHCGNIAHLDRTKDGRICMTPAGGLNTELIAPHDLRNR